MMQLLELLPLAAFFVAYKLGDLYWATGVLIVSCLLVMFATKLHTGKYKDMQVVTALLVLVLGGATLLLHDKRFIVWKPTVLFALLAIAFAASSVFGERPLVQRLFQGAMSLELSLGRHLWRRLNLAWAVWFALIAAANLYIAKSFSENVWVHFHVYGVSIACLIFILPQAVWLASKSSAAEDPAPERPVSAPERSPP